MRWKLLKSGQPKTLLRLPHRSMRVEMNGTNFMDYFGKHSSDANKSKVTGCTFVQVE